MFAFFIGVIDPPSHFPKKITTSYQNIISRKYNISHEKIWSIISIMESDPFARIKITPLDLAKAAGGWALELFQMHLLSPVSEHFQNGGTGSGPALDRELYDQPDLFERVNRWDSEGRDVPEGFQMHHSPDAVKPRDVEAFHPKDRAIALLIDEALRGNEPVRRPGEIGAVACRPTLTDTTGSEQPLIPDPAEQL